ncbi:hypothetical protein [Streptosporangium sp. NPDC000396]|uniref:hypothetical protein n=1 Tax=Streptosporangium sp. NPDC000396 TaxID=3366185 RepID=UPI0036B63829
MPTVWDPVSRQPIYKVAAVRVTRVAEAGGVLSGAPTVGAAAPADPRVPATTGGASAEVSQRLEGE